MKLRLALSALTVAALAAGAPMLASAQTPSGNVVASTPVPNPPEKPHAAKSTHKASHHKTKVSHRRHKAAASATKTASAKPATKAETVKVASAKTTSSKTTALKK